MLMKRDRKIRLRKSKERGAPKRNEDISKSKDFPVAC